MRIWVHAFKCLYTALSVYAQAGRCLFTYAKEAARNISARQQVDAQADSQGWLEMNEQPKIAKT